MIKLPWELFIEVVSDNGAEKDTLDDPNKMKRFKGNDFVKILHKK
ncbi:MAG: hypothetical protein U5K54_26095 [Cytophagales bacterium]|nr:hypothetical protein [Cytophagales bacterium]